ncbi:MAG: transporter permease, partial [Proteobacteria bacterium]|nr:transporter permease [Pseudomonadota bacterium]
MTKPSVFRHSVVPVLAVVAVLVGLWYVAALFMNHSSVVAEAQLKGLAFTPSATWLRSWALDKPLLPAPHQVIAELWRSTAGLAVTSKRSLVYHGWVTLSATLLGFLLGTLFGILLAIGIVHQKVMDKSLMPWIIASQ